MTTVCVNISVLFPLLFQRNGSFAEPSNRLVPQFCKQGTTKPRHLPDFLDSLKLPQFITQGYLEMRQILMTVTSFRRNLFQNEVSHYFTKVRKLAFGALRSFKHQKSGFCCKNLRDLLTHLRHCQWQPLTLPLGASQVRKIHPKTSTN